MHDARIKELLDAYLQHELEFEQYRRLRTEYIDSLIGSTRTIEPEQTTGHDGEAPTTKENAPMSRIPFRQNQLILLGVIVLLLILFVVSTYK